MAEVKKDAAYWIAYVMFVGAITFAPLLLAALLFKWGYDINDARWTPLFFAGGGVFVYLTVWMCKNISEGV